VVDYSAWLGRLDQFVAGWRARLPPERRQECRVHTDPPLTPEELDRLRAGLDRPLPASVAAFLTRAASRVRFECACAPAGRPEVRVGGELFNYYVWSPGPHEYGDRFFGPLEGLPWARDSALAEGEEMARKGCPLDRAFWHHALPLAFTPGTDAPLALWSYDAELAEPPVVSLYHDRPGFLLAETFDDFLVCWEALGYDWGEEYRYEGDGLSGVMSVATPAAVARRKLLGLLK
jgi:hypothetical protein